MPDNSLVSVIITTYNRSDLLDRSIGSAVAQTYDPIEIIVVDDHSEDDTDEAVERWMEKDDRIRYYKNEGKEISESRNTGTKRSKGKYVIYLDDDDELFPHRVKWLMERWEDGLGAVCGGCMFMRPERTIEFIPPPESTYNDILNGQGLAGLFLSRRSYVEEIGGWDPDIGIEDYDMFMRLARDKGPIACVQKITVKIYQDRFERKSTYGRKLGLDYYSMYEKHKEAFSRKQRAYFLFKTMKAWNKRYTFSHILKWVPPGHWYQELAQYIKD